MGKRSHVLFALLCALVVGGVMISDWAQGDSPAVQGFSRLARAESAEGVTLPAIGLGSAPGSLSAFVTTLDATPASAAPPITGDVRVSPQVWPVQSPVTPPVVPDGSVEPELPEAPGAPRAICVAGDMADIITFEAPAEGGTVHAYVLSSSSSSDGPFSVVATAAADTRVFTIPVTTTEQRFYVLSAQGLSKEEACSAVVSNDHVSFTSSVPSNGATLCASNGEVVLELPTGCFAETATVTIEEIEGTPRGGIIALAGVYEIDASRTLAAPARLSVAYTLAVTHHQVSSTLLQAAGLMTYDDTSHSWVDGASDVSAEEDHLSGTLSHLSCWTGATIQPHGTSGLAVNYCTGVCHDLATYPGSTTRYASRDSRVCYNCHGNHDLTAPPAGAPADSENVEASIQGAGVMSRHPVAVGDLYCTACHDPHASPTSSPGLLRAWDPLTGRYVQGGGGVAPGNTLCWTCHGASKNRRVEALVPSYYANSGGDKKTSFGGPHAGLAATDGKTGCRACHAGHGSTTSGIARSTLNGVSVGSGKDDACWACHSVSTSLPGKGSYSASAHYTATSSTRALTTYPGKGIPATSCGKCHGIHGTGKADYTYATGDAECTGCHDAPSNDLTAYGYAGAAALAETSHGALGIKRVTIARRAQFEAGQSFGVVPDTAGGVHLSAGMNVALGCPYTVYRVPWNVPYSPAPEYRYMTNGRTIDDTYERVHASPDASGLGTQATVVDLGTPQSIYSVKLFFSGNADQIPQVVQILTSIDGTTFTSAASIGTLGVDNPVNWTVTLPFSARSARYVKAVFSHQWPPAYYVDNNNVYEMQVAGSGLAGAWVSSPIDVSVPGGSVVSAGITCSKAEPGSSSVTLESAVSTDGGTTWSAWSPVAAGTISGLPAGTSLSNVRVKVRSTLTRPDTVTEPRLCDVTVRVDYTAGTGAVPGQWPSSTVTRGTCLNCHDQHAGNVLRSSSVNTTCQTCHDDPSVSRPESYGYRGSVTYAASAHASKACSDCHQAHGSSGAGEDLLPLSQEEACYGCHPAIRERLSRGGLMSHDMADAGQDATGSALECDDCHQPHLATATIKLIDPTAKWTQFNTQITSPVDGSTQFDSIGFCLKCHAEGSILPAGVAAGSGGGDFNISIYDYLTTNQASWSLPHGGTYGAAGESSSDAGASLRAPFHYNMSPLPCTECHDPHGSSNIYHLRETINGQGPLSITSDISASWRSWCGACHVLPTNSTHTTCTSPWCHDGGHGDN